MSARSQTHMTLLTPGTGKTMVMDMFYSYVETEKKKRVHFHGFMLDVHKRECVVSVRHRSQGTDVWTGMKHTGGSFGLQGSID